MLIRVGSQSKVCASTNEHGFTTASPLGQMGCLYHRQPVYLSFRHTHRRRGEVGVFVNFSIDFLSFQNGTTMVQDH